MSTPYYYLMGQIYLAVYTWEHNSEAREGLTRALQVAGLSKDTMESGGKLVARGEKLVERKLEETVEDRISEHGLHSSIEELEMWMQTVRFRLRKNEIDQKIIDLTMAAELHADDHALTAVAQTFRILGVLRTNKAIHEKLGVQRNTHDLIVRGHTLLKKVISYTTARLAPPSNDDSARIFSELDGQRDEMARWVEENLDTAARQIADRPMVLGLIGYLPEGVGLPVGGTSFAVPLHRFAKSSPPDPADARTTSGWSVGRQGRNRENLGKGFIDPKFD
ncbi:MAG: hypothetical protein ACNA8W_03575 [Bradymonadaceae bacterium]